LDSANHGLWVCCRRESLLRVGDDDTLEAASVKTTTSTFSESANEQLCILKTKVAGAGEEFSKTLKGIAQSVEDLMVPPDSVRKKL
jgi:hypothetical protein